MTTSSKTLPALLSLTLVLGVLSVSVPVWADVAECVEAHSQGQILRDERQLLEARDTFARCNVELCPSPIRTECSQMQQEVERRMPSLLLAARDESDTDVVGVQVFLDDKAFEDGLTGTSIEVDPGPHELRFVYPDGTSVKQHLVALELEKDRPVVAVHRTNTSPAEAAPGAPMPAEEPTASAHPNRTLALVLAGVGVAGVVGFAVLANSGQAEEQRLRDTCAPNCSLAQRDAVSSQYLWADVALALGAASLAGGAYFHFVSSEGAAQTGLQVGWRGVF
jgi:hypothetical protein